MGRARRLGVIDIIDDVVGVRRVDAGASLGTYIALATLNQVVAPTFKLGFSDWWDTTAGARLVKMSPLELTPCGIRPNWRTTSQA